MSENNESLPYLPGSLCPEDAQRARDIAAGINLRDPSLTITYGAQAMENIARFADDMLGRVTAKDAGPAAEILTDLMLKVKDIDLRGISDGEDGVLERLPLVGSLFNKAQRAMARFNTVAGQIDGIGKQLETAMVGLLRDIEVLEQLFEHNREFHRDLSVHIEAGREKLDQVRNADLPALKARAESSGDNMAAQEVRDLANRADRFERRLHDLQLSRAVTLQTAPQIRLIQSNDQNLAEKIQTSILNTIPLWKNQMVLALSLHGQKKAVRMQKDVADTTNALLRKNSEMLHGAAVDTAREVERSIVDVGTLRDVHEKLVATIEETLAIAREGRKNRAEAEAEMRRMELELKRRLTELAVGERREDNEASPA